MVAILSSTAITWKGMSWFSELCRSVGVSFEAASIDFEKLSLDVGSNELIYLADDNMPCSLLL